MVIAGGSALDDYIPKYPAVTVYETDTSEVVGVGLQYNGFTSGINLHGISTEPNMIIGQVQDKQRGELSTLPALNKKQHLDNVVQRLKDEFADTAKDDHYTIIDTRGDRYYTREGHNDLNFKPLVDEAQSLFPGMMDRTTDVVTATRLSHLIRG